MDDSVMVAGATVVVELRLGFYDNACEEQAVELR
jgi:hypothetical protein